MIPSLILVALVAGSVLGLRRPAPLAVVGAVASLYWALLVAVGAGEPATFLGGAALALVNLVVGGLVGLGIHGLLRAVTARDDIRDLGP